MIIETPGLLTDVARHVHRWLRTLDSCLWSLYRLSGRSQAAWYLPAPRTFELKAHCILCLARRDGVRSITVLRGTVWITATPSAGDVLLREGEGMVLEQGWPFVLQAMTAQVSVRLDGTVPAGPGT